MSDVEVRFSHPQAGNLVIETGANQITWAYGLNTQVYPTYAGEVVQILSTYIDDLQIEGECNSYTKMEEIYGYFIRYLELSTQGPSGGGSYNEDPMVLYYPMRGWRLLIKPKSLPAFRYARGEGAPSWQMTAAIVEDDPEMKVLTLEKALEDGFTFERIPADIGYSDGNPFSAPAPEEGGQVATQAADYFNGIIGSYAAGQFESLTGAFDTAGAAAGGAIGSQPADPKMTGGTAKEDK